MMSMSMTIFKLFSNKQPRNVVVMLLLVSWLFMLVSSTCVMSMPVALVTNDIDVMPIGCTDAEHHATGTRQVVHHNQDCALKACPDSQPNPALNLKIDKPDLPVFIVCLTWLSIYIFSQLPCLYIRHRQRRTTANPIPIRYRFCTFLN